MFGVNQQQKKRDFVRRRCVFASSKVSLPCKSFIVKSVLVRNLRNVALKELFFIENNLKHEISFIGNNTDFSDDLDIAQDDFIDICLKTFERKILSTLSFIVNKFQNIHGNDYFYLILNLLNFVFVIFSTEKLNLRMFDK